MSEEHENMNEEEIEEMKDYFDKEVWSQMKKGVKDMTKKESCFFAFLAGSQMMNQVNEMQHEKLGKELEDMEEKLKGMSGEEIKKMLEGEGNELWENKTEINDGGMIKQGEEIEDD